MKEITCEFKDDTDKLITLAMIILSAFFIFIPSLVVIFVPKQYISDSTYNIAKAFFNFELLLFIISLFFAIPIIGWIVGFIIAPFMMIVNVIIVIINLCALAKKSLIKVPVWFEFI